MVPSPAVGSVWGCWSCGAVGPLLTSPCPHCQSELSPVLLATRCTGAAHYNDGLAAALGGFWSEAAEALERAVDLTGPDPGVLGLLGLVYQRAGRVAEALAVWTQAGESGPHTEWAAQVRTAGETQADFAVLTAYNEALPLAHDGRWSEVLSAVVGATGPDSRLAQAFVVKGIAAWGAGLADDAEAAWQRAMELDPSAPGLQTCLVVLIESRAARARQTVAASAQALPPVAAQLPAPAAAKSARYLVAALGALTLLAAGTAAYMGSEAAGARSEASRAADDGARIAKLLEEAKGNIQQTEDAAGKARAALSKAEADLKQATDREAAALDVLLAANPTGRTRDTESLLAAIAHARRLGVSVPSWVEGSLEQNRLKAAVDRYFEGYLFFMSNEYTRALAAFDASLKLETMVYVADDATYLAGRSADLGGDPAEAVRWYQRVVREFPESDYRDDALFFGARAAARSGDPATAVQLYQDLLSRFPGSGYDHDAITALRELGG